MITYTISFERLPVMDMHAFLTSVDQKLGRPTNLEYNQCAVDQKMLTFNATSEADAVPAIILELAAHWPMISIEKVTS